MPAHTASVTRSTSTCAPPYPGTTAAVDPGLHALAVGAHTAVEAGGEVVRATTCWACWTPWAWTSSAPTSDLAARCGGGHGAGRPRPGQRGRWDSSSSTTPEDPSAARHPGPRLYLVACCPHNDDCSVLHPRHPPPQVCRCRAEHHVLHALAREHLAVEVTHLLAEPGMRGGAHPRRVDIAGRRGAAPALATGAVDAVVAGAGAARPRGRHRPRGERRGPRPRPAG